MCVGRLWQSMQSIRRAGFFAESSAVSCVSVLRYVCTVPSGAFRAHPGNDWRPSSVAMYVTLLPMFMCQWMPDVGPGLLLPPPILIRRSSFHLVFFSPDVKYVLLISFSL